MAEILLIRRKILNNNSNQSTILKYLKLSGNGHLPLQYDCRYLHRGLNKMFQVSSGDSTVIVLFVIHRFFGIEVGKGMHAPLYRFVQSSAC